MKEVPQGECAEGDRITSRGNPQHNPTTQKHPDTLLTDGVSSVHEETVLAQSNCSESDEASTGDASETGNVSKPTSSLSAVSRRHKLSLRRAASHQAKSKAPREVIKAILGETTLNQSSDFKEPLVRGSINAPKGKRRIGSSLSRSKQNRSSKATALSELSCSAIVDDARESDEKSDERPTKTQTAEPQNRNAGVTVANVSAAKDSPIKGCKVYVSKLKLSTASRRQESKNLDPMDKDTLPEVQSTNQPSSKDSAQVLTSDSPSRLASSPERKSPLSKTRSSCPDGGPTQKRCLSCGETFSGQDAAESQRKHIQQCLRQRFAAVVKTSDGMGNSDDTSGDEEFARRLQKREDEKRQEELLTETERFFCHICQRELTHMNSTRRGQHINRCIDNLEKIEPPTRIVNSRPQPASRKISDCPMCGKHFKTKKQRESHLKKCARENNVSPQRLIALVRVQEGASESHSAQGTGAVAASVTVGTAASLGTRLGTDSVGGTTVGSSGRGVATGVATKDGGRVGVLGVPVASTTLGESHGPRMSNTRPIGILGTTMDIAGGNQSAGVLGAAAGGPQLSNRPSGSRRGRPARGGTATRGKGKRKQKTETEAEPLDEETRVALALSASLYQKPYSLGSVEGADGQITSEPAKPPGKRGRKKRTTKKETIKEVPILIQRTEEERKRVLGERMADIILPKGNRVLQKTPIMKLSKVAVKHKPSPWRRSTRMRAVARRTRQASGNKCANLTQESALIDERRHGPVPLLWSLASASDPCSQTPFYVPQLLPVVTPQKRKTPQRGKDVNRRGSLPRMPSPVESSQQKSVICDATSPPLSSPLSQGGVATQSFGSTCLLLAELAAESAGCLDSQYSETSLIRASGFIPANGIDEEEKEDEEKDEEEEEEEVEEVDEQRTAVQTVTDHERSVLCNLSEMVNNRSLSDLHFLTSDGSTLNAHQFLIKLRCPILAQLIEETPSCSDGFQAKTVDLQDYNRTAILSVLDFIYAGKLTVNSSDAKQVEQFAERFSLSALSDYCTNLFSNIIHHSMASKSVEPTQAKGMFHVEQQEKTPGQDSDTFVEKGLDELLLSLWDSEDDSDRSRRGDSDNDSDREIEELTAFSQPRRRISHQATDTENDAEDREEAPDEQDLEEIYEFFSTQRRKNSQRNQSGNLSGMTELSASDSSSDENKDGSSDENKNGSAVKQNCHNVSTDRRRQSLGIIDQLQSSCSPQTQKSNASLDQVSIGLTASPNDDCIAPEHRKGQDSDKVNALETLPCFVRMEKLSSDLTVSPMKENQVVALTVSSCLENQKNLKCGRGESRIGKNGKKFMNRGEKVDCEREHLGGDCSFIRDTDATLADVRDSIFYSDDDKEVEPMDFSQSTQIDSQQSTQSPCQIDALLDGIQIIEHHNDEDSILRIQPFERASKLAKETKSKTGASGMISSTLSPWKPDTAAADRTTSPSKSKPRPSGTSTSACSLSSLEDESVLPFVDVRSQPQPDKPQTSESASTGKPLCQEKGLVSDSRSSDDGVIGSQETSISDVIDLSQDGDDKDDDATDHNEDSSGSAQDSDKDDAWVLPQTPPSLASKSKSAAVSLYHKPPLKQQGAVNPLRARKFNFRRRDKTKSDDESTSGRPESNKHPVKSTVKPFSGEDFTSVTETPAAFRADMNKIRDSSTPIYDPISERVSYDHGHVSPRVSPVETGTDAGQKKDEKLGHVKSPFKVAVSPRRHGRALERGSLNDASPDLRTLTRGMKEASDTDLEELEGLEHNTLSQRSRTSVTFGDDRGLDEGRQGLSDVSDTPIRSTPDCFDADTPLLVRSIPAPPVSPSPPPSPIFVKPHSATSQSSVRESLEETIIDEGNTDYGSLSLRCKRKLQGEDSDNYEVPPKRPKSHTSRSTSFIEANSLSPLCISDEDDDVLISTEDESNKKLGMLTSKDGTAASSMEGHTTPWSGQLCVGQSPTRESLDTVPDIETDEVLVLSSDESSQDSSTPTVQIKETLSPEHTISYRAGRLQVSPIEQDKLSPSSESLPPEKETIEAGSFPKSQSSADRTYSPSPPNDNEYQFAYFGDDGGGYMDDFKFYAEGGEVSREKSAEQEIRKPQCGGGFSSLKEKPCTNQARTSKYSSSLSNHGNESIRSFPSSDEEKSPQRGSSRDVLSESVLLRDEAQEFACSESFLQELKAGHIDEEAAWGGVRLTEGGPSKQHPKKTVSEVGIPVIQTPVVNRKQPMGKETVDELYYPPAPITPMPPYEDMSTPLLKNELKRFGVKPLPKKKARMKLKEMYNHTHQVLEDEDSDTDKSGPITFKLPSASAKPTSTTTQKPAPKKAAHHTKAPQQRGKKPTAQRKGQDAEDVVKKPRYPESEMDGGDPFSEESDDSGSSQSDTWQDGEDDDDDDNDDDDDDDLPEPSQMTSANIQEAIRVFIRKNSNWYEKILQYEPLDIDAFKAELKSSGIRYSMNNLKEFLDNHSITYRNLSSKRNRHVRKPKKPKSK